MNIPLNWLNTELVTIGIMKNTLVPNSIILQKYHKFLPKQSNRKLLRKLIKQTDIQRGTEILYDNICRIKRRVKHQNTVSTLYTRCWIKCDSQAFSDGDRPFLLS